jgi:hypothetical protein
MGKYTEHNTHIKLKKIHTHKYHKIKARRASGTQGPIRHPRNKRRPPHLNWRHPDREQHKTQWHKYGIPNFYLVD